MLSIDAFQQLPLLEILLSMKLLQKFLKSHLLEIIPPLWTMPAKLYQPFGMTLQEVGINELFDEHSCLNLQKLN